MITHETLGNRTRVLLDGVHVGTFIVQAKPKRKGDGCVWWCTASAGGHVGSESEALRAIEDGLPTRDDDFRQIQLAIG